MSSHPSDSAGHQANPTPLDVLREAVRQSSRGDEAFEARLFAALEPTLTGLEMDQLEGSVRCGRDGVLSSCRVMIERCPLPAILAISEVLGTPLPPLAESLAEVARDGGTSFIGGWDLSGRVPRSKFYVNASNASERVRSRLFAALGSFAPAPSLTVGSEPHVVGLNLEPDGFELKLYVQSNHASELAAPFSPEVRAFAERFERAGISGGAVTSYDVEEGTLTPRAFFVAIRTESPAALDEAMRTARGWSLEAISKEGPFAAGPVRSVGVSLSDPRVWTAYFKPSSVPDLPWKADPDALFRTGQWVLGVRLEPRDKVARAYAKTRDFAISYIPAEGQPPPPVLVERLLHWVVESVRRSERTGTPVAFDRPPAPWVREG